MRLFGREADIFEIDDMHTTLAKHTRLPKTEQRPLFENPGIVYARFMIARTKVAAHRTLTRLGARIGTDLVYLAKGGFWINIRQFLAMAFSLLTALLFGRYVSQEVYGEYKYLVSIFSLLTTLTLTGLGSGVMQAIARGNEGTLPKAFWLNLRWSVFACAGAIGYAGYQLAQGNTTQGIALLLIAVTFPFIRSFQLAESFYTGTRQFQKNALLKGTADTLLFLAVAIVAIWTNNVLLILCAFLFTSLISEGTIYLYTRSRITHLERVEYDVFSFSKHLSVTGIVSSIAGQADKLLVYHVLGAVPLAVYTFALAIPKQFRTAVSFVAPLAKPKYAVMEEHQVRTSVFHKFVLSQAILIPATIVYWLAAPWIYQTFFPQYVESVTASRLYALIFPLFGNFSFIAFETQKKTRETYLSTLIPSVIQIALMVACIFPFGINGVILATLIAKYGSTLYSLLLVSRMRTSNT